MNNLKSHVQNYLEYCREQKRLDEKTIKAYRIDLRQFVDYYEDIDVSELSSDMIEDYIAGLHKKYKPKTVRRKIASLKALFHDLEYRDILVINPFNKIRIRFREPVILPKIIPLYVVELFLKTIYNQRQNAKTPYQRRNALRDVAVIELLFATGMRISEICALKKNDVDLHDGIVLIYGKGDKERRIQICNDAVIEILREYKNEFADEVKSSNHFFSNQSGKSLSDQAVRRMIKKYSQMAAIELHITPHMFRHTFATSLIEAGVDIRIVQELLGHSSINITEIYTHVTVSKQRDVLLTKHPRKNFKL